jgi:GntR family transcriptional regulator, transcriptional repressor for pyruvate dehydrogenase complex
VEGFKPIKKQKASDLIVEEIWKMILEGKLKPGDRLPPEFKLVERFQVSKVTLREALQTLENYGHITRKRGPGGGSIVLDIAPTMGISMLANYLSLTNLSLDHLMEARMFLEPAIAEAAAARMSPESAGRLTQLLSDHERDFQTHGGSKRGWEFYILLAELTGNRLLKVMEELLIRLFMDAEFALSIGDIGMTAEEIAYNAEVLPTNRRVAEAVISGDPERARREMTAAIAGFRERISRYADQFRRTGRHPEPRPASSGGH